MTIARLLVGYALRVGPAQSAAIEFAKKIGVSAETLRERVQRAEVDGRQRSDLTTGGAWRR